MEASNKQRIVLLGKMGAGKSSLASTIFGEDEFKINHSRCTEPGFCQAQTKAVNGRSITLIDTPGFFGTDRPEEELKTEIMRCITECTPGPHAFLIVLRVEKFSKQEKAVIEKIRQYFSEQVFKYAAVVFTHGDQLPEGMKIEEFVDRSEDLSGLLKKCGGRCHVVDNKYWQNNQEDEYRSNQFQVAELLKTIDKIVVENNGGYYTNEKLSASNFLKLLISSAIGALLGALLGLPVMAVSIVLWSKPAAAVSMAIAAVGATVGGYTGYWAALGAETVWEAIKKLIKAVCNKILKWF